MAGGDVFPTLLGLFTALTVTPSVLGKTPQFDVPIVNVTVVAGQTAVLPCSIDYLGKYKVVWVREVAWVDHNTIPLTYEDRRVVDDARFSIVRPYIKEWNLQIRDVAWTDQGQYLCTINTTPVKYKTVMLHVKVPAQIIDELSSDDITVQEGDTVILVCNVTGVPRPEVTWYRRPANSKISEKERIGLTGEMIIIQNVSRYCDDIYECVANNGVPPAVSRQMRVTVEFAPEIRMPNKRIGQARGKDTILECVITAYPHAVNYWGKDGKRVTSSSKHRIEAYDEGDHTITLSLRIHNIDYVDFGKYMCVAANALGRDEEAIHLYEYVEPVPGHHRPTDPIIVLGPWTNPPTRPPNGAGPTNGQQSNKITDKNANHNKVSKEGSYAPASGRVTNSASSPPSQDYLWPLALSLALNLYVTLSQLARTASV